MMKAANAKLMGKVFTRFALLAALLAGCAGQQLHDDGMALMAAGRPEEGLVKLTEATRAAPDNLNYHADLIRSREQTVNSMLAAANREREGGRQAAAQAIYAGILRIDPGNSRADLGLEALAMDQRHDVAIAAAETQFKKHALEAAQATLKPVLQEDPRNGRALLLQRQIDEQVAKDALAQPTLKAAFSKPVSLQFRDANLKMVFEALSRTSGINILLDKDVRPDLKASLFVKDVSVEDTINLILMQNQLEKKVLSDNTVFIYPSTPAKLKDYQDLKIRSFHLTHADPKQMLTMLKTLLKTKDIFIHDKTNSIVMRDTPDAIRLAEKMMADQDIAEPEVMLEVEVFEVSRSRASELGIRFPQTFGVATPKSVETLGDLKNLSGNDLVVTPLAAVLNLRLEDTDTNVLASPRIRVRNREKAKVMIGSRVPVITNSVTPLATGSAVTTGSVQYLDVGLKLEVEPDIHLDNEVVIKVGLDVSNIIKQVQNTESGTVAYEVGTRNANTVLRLKDGETQILAGLISDEDRTTASKVPGLGQIPILGRLFSSHKDDSSKSEIVLSITPHIVGSASLPDINNQEYWTGTESSTRDGLLNIKSVGSIVATTSAVASTSASPSPLVRSRPMAPPPRTGAPASQQPPSPATPVTLSWQGPAQVKQGEKLSLTLNAQSQQSVSSLELRVNFDPAVFKAIEVTPGSYLKQGNFQPALNKTINQESGQIQMSLASAGAVGTSGTGSLATLVFEAIAANPQSQIVVEQIVPVGPGGEALPATQPNPLLIEVAP
jgi:general secretion pathway protein D